MNAERPAPWRDPVVEAYKRAAGRPKDLEAIGELEALRGLGHAPPEPVSSR